MVLAAASDLAKPFFGCAIEKITMEIPSNNKIPCFIFLFFSG
jgi:hypothetical protein